MAQIVECRYFNCPNNKDHQCQLEEVRLVVIENELYCEDAQQPSNADAEYI